MTARRKTARTKFPNFKPVAQRLLKQVSLSSQDLEKELKLAYCFGVMAGRLHREQVMLKLLRRSR